MLTSIPFLIWETLRFLFPPIPGHTHIHTRAPGGRKDGPQPWLRRDTFGKSLAL